MLNFEISTMELSTTTYENWALYKVAYYEPFWGSKYVYCSANPINKIDPTGMSDDWVKDNVTGSYSWMDNATSSSNTPNGYSYVGAKNSDIVTDMGASSQYGTQTETANGVGAMGGDGVGPLGNGVMGGTKADVSASLSVKADVSSNPANASENNKQGKTFEGITVTTNVSERTASASGDMSSNSGGTLSVTNGNQNYSTTLSSPTGSFVYETGTKPTTASVHIPASKISATSYPQSATVKVGYTNPGVTSFPVRINWNLQTRTTLRPGK